MGGGLEGRSFVSLPLSDQYKVNDIDLGNGRSVDCINAKKGNFNEKTFVTGSDVFLAKRNCELLWIYVT